MRAESKNKPTDVEAGMYVSRRKTRATAQRERLRHFHCAERVDICTIQNLTTIGRAVFLLNS